MNKNKKQEGKSFFEKTRAVQIALLVIIIAVGSVMVFNNTSSSTDANPAPKAIASEGDSDVMVLTDAIFEQTISEGVVLVDFWATWCPPCRIQNPIIEELAGEIGNKAIIGKVDVDHNPQTAGNNGIQNIPTLIIYKDGKQVQRFVGVQQKETLKAAIESHI